MRIPRSLPSRPSLSPREQVHRSHATFREKSYSTPAVAGPVQGLVPAGCLSEICVTLPLIGRQCRCVLPTPF